MTEKELKSKLKRVIELVTLAEKTTNLVAFTELQRRSIVSDIKDDLDLAQAALNECVQTVNEWQPQECK